MVHFIKFCCSWHILKLLNLLSLCQFPLPHPCTKHPVPSLPFCGSVDGRTIHLATMEAWLSSWTPPSPWPLINLHKGTLSHPSPPLLPSSSLNRSTAHLDHYSCLCLQLHPLSPMLLQMVSVILSKHTFEHAAARLKIFPLKSFCPSRKLQFLIMLNNLSFPFWTHFYPPCTLCVSHAELPGVPGTRLPLSHVCAFECVSLSPRNSFFSLLSRTIPTHIQEPAPASRSVCLSGHQPSPVGVGNSLICVPIQILKTSIRQFTVRLPHQTPWRWALGPQHLGQYPAPGGAKEATWSQFPQGTLS